jgi:hypothetical protein
VERRLEGRKEGKNAKGHENSAGALFLFVLFVFFGVKYFLLGSAEVTPFFRINLNKQLENSCNNSGYAVY